MNSSITPERFAAHSSPPELSAKLTDRHSADMRTLRDLYQSGLFGQAAAVAREMLLDRPRDLMASTIVAACLFKQGRIAEALERAETTLEFFPEAEDVAALRDIFLQALAAERWVAERVTGLP
jgi:hypothetical protein